MQDKKIMIRKAKMKEAPIIKELKFEVFDTIISKYYDKEQVDVFKKTNSVPIIKKRIKNKNNYILSINNEIIATIYINNANRPAGFAVKPEYQGHGHGKRLLSFIEDLFRKEGHKKITLNSTINSVGFYSKMGYKKIKDNHMTILDIKFPTVYMEKTL